MIFPTLPSTKPLPQIIDSTTAPHTTAPQQPPSTRREKHAFLTAKPPTKHEPIIDEEEKEQKKNDEELKELLNSGLLEFNKQEEGGKEWRRYKVQQLLKKHNIKPVKMKMPMTCAIGMAEKREERRLKELQEAKDAGMYHTSLKHIYQSKNKKTDAQAANKKKVQRGGITRNPGKFKDGVLHINKKLL